MPINADNVLVTDDQTTHTGEETNNNNKSKVILVSHESIEEKSKFLSCNGSDKKSKSLSINTKLTTTCTASGLSALMF